MAAGHASCAGDSQGSFAVAGLLAEVPSEPLLRARARTQCVSLGSGRKPAQYESVQGDGSRCRFI
jgi:hypothetical protein